MNRESSAFLTAVHPVGAGEPVSTPFRWMMLFSFWHCPETSMAPPSPPTNDLSVASVQ